MANIIFRGSNVPELQDFQETYRQRRGFTAKYTLKGIATTDGWQQIALDAADAQLAGYDWDLSYKQGIAELTVQTPDGSVSSPFGTNNQSIIDKWEVATDEEKPSLFESDNFIAWATNPDIALADDPNGIGATFSSQLMSVIQSLASNPTIQFTTSSGQQTTYSGQAVLNNLTVAMFNLVLNNAPAMFDNGNSYPNNVAISGNSIPSGGDSLYTVYQNAIGNGGLQQLALFAADYLRGATEYEHSKYVLRHTTNVPNNYTSDVADFNVEKIYTIAQLLSEAQSTSLWILPLPSYLAYKILNYAPPPVLWNDYIWGALKLRSNAVTTARNRIEITQEYLIDSWPIHTYGLIS